MNLHSTHCHLVDLSIVPEDLRELWEKQSETSSNKDLAKVLWLASQTRNILSLEGKFESLSTVGILNTLRAFNKAPDHFFCLLDEEECVDLKTFTHLQETPPEPPSTRELVDSVTFCAQEIRQAKPKTKETKLKKQVLTGIVVGQDWEALGEILNVSEDFILKTLKEFYSKGMLTLLDWQNNVKVQKKKEKKVPVLDECSKEALRQAMEENPNMFQGAFDVKDWVKENTVFQIDPSQAQAFFEMFRLKRKKPIQTVVRVEPKKVEEQKPEKRTPLAWRQYVPKFTSWKPDMMQKGYLQHKMDQANTDLERKAWEAHLLIMIDNLSYRDAANQLKVEYKDLINLFQKTQPKKLLCKFSTPLDFDKEFQSFSNLESFKIYQVAQNSNEPAKSQMLILWAILKGKNPNDMVKSGQVKVEDLESVLKLAQTYQNPAPNVFSIETWAKFLEEVQKPCADTRNKNWSHPALEKLVLNLTGKRLHAHNRAKIMKFLRDNNLGLLNPIPKFVPTLSKG